MATKWPYCKVSRLSFNFCLALRYSDLPVFVYTVHEKKEK